MNIANKLINVLQDKLEANCRNGIVEGPERLTSLIGGAAILGIGIKQTIRKPAVGLPLLSLGGMIFWRGVSGRCAIKQMISNEIKAQKNINNIL